MSEKAAYADQLADLGFQFFDQLVGIHGAALGEAKPDRGGVHIHAEFQFHLFVAALCTRVSGNQNQQGGNQILDEGKILVMRHAVEFVSLTDQLIQIPALQLL